MAKIVKNKYATIDENLLSKLREGEVVKPIPWTQHYFVTNYGRVFSAKKRVHYEFENGIEKYCNIWVELKQRLCNGYLSVNIDNKREYVHKLVFKSFNDYIDTKVIRILHRDGDKLNNNLNNLTLDWRNKYNKSDHETYVWRMGMKSLNLLNSYDND